jgi:hypothetical protein
MQLEYTGYNIQPVTQEERLNEIHCSVWRVRMVTHTHIRWAVGGYEVAHSILSADLCMVTNIQWRTVTTAWSDLYKACSKKDRTSAMKTLLLTLHHFKQCPLQSSPLYWRYTVPSVISIVRMHHFVMARSSLTVFSRISSVV